MRRQWQVRLPLGILAALCLALVVVSPGEGAPRRPKVTWQHLENYECSQRPSGSEPLCLAVEPGAQPPPVSVSVTANADVVKPRLLFMSANGANVIKVVAGTLPPVLAAGERLDFTIKIEPVPNLRARHISGRIYLADRFSVLSPPLNVRIEILHPTPEQLARTPVVVPTNHIQMVLRPPSTVQEDPADARFNIRHLVVTSGTNVTWTHRAAPPDDPQIKRAVKGTLCDPTQPLSPSEPCAPHPATIGPCALTVDPVNERLVTDVQGRTLCFISPRLGVSGHYSIKLTRPLTRQPLTYYMEDALHDTDTMVEVINDRKYHPYLTVR
jgi:hypothetical protein